jgi:hypothetical protein
MREKSEPRINTDLEAENLIPKGQACKIQNCGGRPVEKGFEFAGKRAMISKNNKWVFIIS